MSSALQERLKGLFGTSTLADAEVLFVLETAADGSKRLTIGEKLPAHQFVLRLSSTFIAASLDRHNDMQRNGAADGLPGLRVRMRSADELSAARDALRYCYTGGLSSQTFRDLLLVRRFAVELQISGCEEAADNLMSEWLANHKHNALDLYACDHLFPEEPAATPLPPTQPTGAAPPSPAPVPPFRFGAVLAAAKRQVVEHFRDAPRVLRSPELQQQALELPARGMLALLESDGFGTDDESSVLLLLARWLEARGYRALGGGTNGGAGGSGAGGSGGSGGGGGGGRYPPVSFEVVAQLCRHVRLVNLSACALTYVLPRIAWFDQVLERHELAFLVRCAATVAAHPHVARNASQLLLLPAGNPATLQPQALPGAPAPPGGGGSGGGGAAASAGADGSGAGAAAGGAGAAGGLAVGCCLVGSSQGASTRDMSEYYKTLLDVMGHVYGTATAPWYAWPRRQVLPPGGRAVRWSVTSGELLVALRSNQAKTYVAAKLHLSDEDEAHHEDGEAEEDAEGDAAAAGAGGADAGGGGRGGGRTASSIIVRGMEYSVRLRVSRGGPATAGAYIKCIAPSPFGFIPAGQAVPLARLMVYRWRNGAREVAHTFDMLTEGQALGIHKYSGQQNALPLLAVATQTQQHQAAARHQQVDQDDATPHQGAGAGGGGGGAGAGAGRGAAGGRRQAGEQADELAPWKEYLHGGCVSGALLLLPGQPALV